MALWTPLNLQSVALVGWYRVRDPLQVVAPGADVFNGTDVTAWKDRSGRGNDLPRFPRNSATEMAYKPNGFGAGLASVYTSGIYYGTGWFGPFSSPVGRIGAFSAISQAPSQSSGARVLSIGSVAGGNAGNQDYSAPNGQILYAGNNDGTGIATAFDGPNISVGISVNTPSIVGSYYKGKDQQGLSVNGVEKAFITRRAYDNTPGNLGIGSNGAYKGGYWIGEHAEHVLFIGTLTLEDQQLLEGYLAWNNGTQGGLPDAHPYKAAAPTTGGGTTPPKADPIPLKPLAKGGAFGGRSSGRLATALRPRAAGSTFSGRFVAKIGLTLGLRAAVARFSGQARPKLATRLQFRPAGGAFVGRGQLLPASPGRFLPAGGAFGARARLSLSTAFRARPAPEAFTGRAKGGIRFTFGPMASGGAFRGQAWFAKATTFRPRPAPGAFKASSHASIAVQLHAQPAGGRFEGSGRLGRTAAAAIVLTPQQSAAVFGGRARLALSTALRGRQAPELFAGRSAVRIRYSFRGLARGGSFFARGFVVPVNPAADGRPYGPGGYGVGNYGTGTPVELAARGAWRMSARAKPAIGPVFHPRPARSTFKATARFVPWVAFRARPAAGRGVGKARPWVGPVFHPQPSTGRFFGSMAALLQGKEIVLLPGAMPAGGSVRAVLLFRAPFLRAPIRASGRTGRLRTVVIWHKGPRLGQSWSGHWTAQIYPQVRARGRELFKGRAGARMLFKAPFYASPSRYAGHVVVSYSWSNLTAPGRAPTPTWESAIPGASPLDPWSLVPAAPGAWDRVE